MKKTTAMCGIMLMTMFNLHSETKPNVEAIMYLDMEMPCLANESLSGRIVIRNNGDGDIKLLRRMPNFPDMLVHQQLYVRMDVPEEEEMRMGAKPAMRWRARSYIKEDTDYEIQEGGGFVTLKKGESLEVNFQGREVTVPHGAENKRVTMVAELYLSPDKWIPVEIRPPLVVAGDAKLTFLSHIKAGSHYDENAPWVYHAKIDTNEVLFVKEKRVHRRLSDLHPDDIVTYSNKVITITQKDGKVRTIPEADIARVSAERAEEKRKARQQKGEN